ncbi:MAG TPA: ATP-binding protein [Verrucomicrobiae bacterium]|nr:ATP-binding protein [Verrucomicrobiae bacterium]
MSARSQRNIVDAVEGLNLAPALRDSLSPGLLVVNQHHQILSCTAEAIRLLSLGSTIPTKASQLPAALQQIIRTALTTHGSLTTQELVVTRDDCHNRSIQVSVLPVPSDHSNHQLLVVLSDITGFRQIEQAVTRLDRLATIGTLSASMAHEIKNALVAVKTFVDLLLEKNKDAELATIVGREMNRVNLIVNQLLKHARPIGPTPRSTVRLHDVLEHSLRMVQHQLNGKLIAINRSFNAAPDAVQGDDCQLEQVFVNLFLNAIEATGDNGTLTVETELLARPPSDPGLPKPADQPHVRIIVADTGSGIEPDHLDRMFEPFFTTKRHGTGLGLPITRRIVQEHNGLITVQSEPKKGTTFSILLPADGKSH